MFEGLRDKLGSFTEDVEEQAETVEEDVDPEELDTPIDPEETAAESSETPDEAVATEPDSDDNDIGLGERARSLVTGRVILDEDDLSGPLWELELALLESDVEVEVAEALTDRLESELVGERRTVIQRTSSVVTPALRDALLEILAVGQFDFEARLESIDTPIVIVFTGVNGVGKTTSIAKLSRYLSEQGYSTVMANGDTFRAGAEEQIATHADRLDVELISHEQGGDPAAVLYDAKEYATAHDIDVVLADTAGRLHTSKGLMDQLEKIGRVVDPDLTLFVDEAVAGQDAVNRAREFDEAIPIDGTILTKADADSSGGAALSIAHVTGKPILFLGTGQGYDDLERFDPERMVDRLLDGT